MRALDHAAVPDTAGRCSYTGVSKHARWDTCSWEGSPWCFHGLYVCWAVVVKPLVVNSNIASEPVATWGHSGQWWEQFVPTSTLTSLASQRAFSTRMKSLVNRVRDHLGNAASKRFAFKPSRSLFYKGSPVQLTSNTDALSNSKPTWWQFESMLGNILFSLLEISLVRGFSPI